ncbi:MAG: hypothetical protein O7F73_16985 [Gammaproteobacteria bacterium]|nr:hypothetical protein [Gammaproteobacteria bacterium]
MLSNLVECELDAIEIGMRVEVCFIPRGEEFVLPMFKPGKD